MSLVLLNAVSRWKIISILNRARDDLQIFDQLTFKFSFKTNGLSQYSTPVFIQNTFDALQGESKRRVTAP